MKIILSSRLLHDMILNYSQYINNRDKGKKKIEFEFKSLFLIRITNSFIQAVIFYVPLQNPYAIKNSSILNIIRVVLI